MDVTGEPATIYRTVLIDRNYCTRGFIHYLYTKAEGFLSIQLYDTHGTLISFSSMPAIVQKPEACDCLSEVQIPVLHESYYPVTVVMVG